MSSVVVIRWSARILSSLIVLFAGCNELAGFSYPGRAHPD